MSEAAARWSAWKTASFGSDLEIGHDGLDVAVVTRLRGEARAHALEMLGLGLALGDDRAAQALAAMGEAGQLDEMRRLLARSRGSARVRVALAVHSLRGEPDLASHLIAVLHDGDPWSARIDAAIGLRAFNGADDEAALLTAVGDPAYLVRYHACESLLARWRVRPAAIAEYGQIFARIVEPAEGKPTLMARRRHAEARTRLLALRG